jgi:replicative DNA helicase
VDQNGRVEICLSNLALLEQVRELALSLGHKPGPIRLKAIPRGGRVFTAWRLSWGPLDNVFRLSAKATRLATWSRVTATSEQTRRAITAIEPCPSVPVRCITVDSPNHLYLAGKGMIPTHNTAMALGIAAHASMIAHVPVLFFSLEMSHSEVTQRLLCSEARVNSTRIRNGRLHESDWPKISHAIGRLGEAPLYIDDNPNLTVMEIRAKARRLRSRLGALGLIVVDYLQLMTGRNSAENRQVEVSEISRGLKILARELEVPVVALSQLSRNLELRADKRPALADLRESGCMPASTRLLRADNGREVSLGSLALTREQPLVWSVDEHQRLVPARLVSAFPTGIKPVFTMRLASGRSVDATANHRFLTVDGWERLDALAPGARLAVPRRVPPSLHQDAIRSEDKLTLAASGRGLRRFSRSGLATTAKRLGSEQSNDHASSDLHWAEVVEIIPIGDQPTFDATVDETHNFIADGIVAHNSLEQDADVVMFIYRDEVYNPESPDRGSAEIIISKHRNGPTGITNLAFLGDYTRFDNMARL